MATYKGIQGYSVKKLSSDPPASASTGQLWYNSSSGKFKITTGAAGAWSSGGNMNTGRQQAGASGVSQDSALCFAGSPAGGTATIITESYNGTAWTEVADMSVPRKSMVGIGTQTAALACGGTAPPPTPVGPNLQEVEQWNGTSWTEVGDLNRTDSPPVSCAYAGGFGSTTSAMFAGGGDPPNLQLAEEWNGTSWAEGNDLVAGQSYCAGAGTTADAGIITGGYDAPGSKTGINQEWNATSWTEVGDLNTARLNQSGSSGQGSVTSSLCFGGNSPAPARVGLTEKWNGTSWTEVADLATARHYLMGAGVEASCAAFGGNPPTPASSYNVTEEWSDPVLSIKTVTVS